MNGFVCVEASAVFRKSESPAPPSPEDRAFVKRNQCRCARDLEKRRRRPRETRSRRATYGPV